MSPTQIFERTAVLQGAEPAVIQHFADRATLRQLRRGEVLWQAGDASDVWAIVRSGLIKLVRRAPHGRSAICALHGPPDCVGELPALRGAPFTTSAIAATSSASVVIVSRDVLLQAVRVFPPLGLAFARH